MQWYARTGIGWLRSARVVEIVLVLVGTFELVGSRDVLEGRGI